MRQTVPIPPAPISSRMSYPSIRGGATIGAGAAPPAALRIGAGGPSTQLGKGRLPPTRVGGFPMPLPGGGAGASVAASVEASVEAWVAGPAEASGAILSISPSGISTPGRDPRARLSRPPRQPFRVIPARLYSSVALIEWMPSSNSARVAPSIQGCRAAHSAPWRTASSESWEISVPRRTRAATIAAK